MKKYKKPLVETVITGLDNIMDYDDVFGRSSDKDDYSKRNGSTWEEPEEDAFSDW